MADEKNLSADQISEAWYVYLTTGGPPDYAVVPWYHRRRMRSLYRHLPANPRCRLCHAPFHGIGGIVMDHVFGMEPSRLNPQICNVCEEFANRYQGGTELELSILFADVRGSTSLAENMNATDFSRLINRFYNAATKVLYGHGGLVEKLIGDAVTGFFTQAFGGPNHAKAAVETAREIIEATGHHDPDGPWIPVGIGVHTGLAYVGTVNSEGGAADIVVLGDTANTGARLASLAQTGEICISQAAAQAAGISRDGVSIKHEQVKGRAEPVEVWVLS